MQHTVKGEHTEMLMDIKTKTALQRSKHTHISRHTQALLSSKISLTRQFSQLANQKMALKCEILTYLSTTLNCLTLDLDSSGSDRQRYIQQRAKVRANRQNHRMGPAVFCPWLI